ncbi:MAG TPA: hypothetical protein PLF04_09775 [Candidatus Fermentibacter daniensis]|jgi:hypothetical protein|nr:hypothetical protein [Deltaproteobacteria bacterium]HOZ18600.1 hypothetical protein [Candidatus Fermentibacter daniensis]HPH40478.1 hypothetical protein [Candidatus Fermentibacter daniensis]
MKIRTIALRLPQAGVSALLRVYSSRDSFVRHCHDHFLDPGDCWSVFLPPDLLKRCRKDLESNLGTLYDKVYLVIEAAIDDAIGQPYYAIIKGGKHTGFRFLARNAMMVICNRKTVSTAYIPASISTYSRSVWPEISWEKLVRELNIIESYPGVSIRRVSEENWKRSPGFVSSLGRLAEEALRRKRNAPDSGDRN